MEQSYKQREIDAIRKTQDEITRRVRGWPIYESDKGQIAVGLDFWIDGAVEKLQAVEWADAEPPVPVDEAAAKRIHALAKKEEQQQMEMLEKQNA